MLLNARRRSIAFWSIIQAIIAARPPRPHPAADHRQWAAAERGRGLAAATPHHRPGAGAARDADAGAPHRRGQHKKPSRSLSAQSGPAGRSARGDAGTALEIAGRSMFSLEMWQYGAEMRANSPRMGCAGRARICSTCCCRRRSRRYATCAAAGSSTRWMRLIDGIMQARMHAPPTETPRDLFDLLRAARDPGNRARLQPRPTARSDRDDDAGRTRDNGGDAVLGPGMLCRGAGRAGAYRRRGARPRSGQRNVRPPRYRAWSARGAVISETLRLYPPAFTMRAPRSARTGPGTSTFRAGAIVMIAPWVLHRHRRLWRDPELFDPYALPAGRAAAAALRLPAVRRRPARLRRRAVRAGGGNAGAGGTDPVVSRCALDDPRRCCRLPS